LLFSTAQLAGTVVGTLFKAYAGYGLAGHFASSASVNALEGEGDGDILLGGEAGDEVEGLEDEADGATAIDGPLPAVHGAEVAAVDGDGSGVWGIEATKEMEECGFSRSAHAEDGKEFAMGNPEVHVVERLDRCRSHAILAG